MFEHLGYELLPELKEEILSHFHFQNSKSDRRMLETPQLVSKSWNSASTSCTRSLHPVPPG
jgi:hypothetical protein